MSLQLSVIRELNAFVNAMSSWYRTPSNDNDEHRLANVSERFDARFKIISARGEPSSRQQLIATLRGSLGRLPTLEISLGEVEIISVVVDGLGSTHVLCTFEEVQCRDTNGVRNTTGRIATAFLKETAPNKFAWLFLSYVFMPDARVAAFVDAQAREIAEGKLRDLVCVVPCIAGRLFFFIKKVLIGFATAVSGGARRAQAHELSAALVIGNSKSSRRADLGQSQVDGQRLA